jgi:hypothetical protein
MGYAKTVGLAVLIGVSGCSYLPDSADMSEIVSPHKFGTFSPMPFYLRNIPEDNSSYSIGFRDGCNTYLGFAGSGLIQNRGFTYDIERSLKDRPYAAGFREGANLCLYYTDTRPN